ncbi:MAG TPA: tyrosine-protein phosphatase [Microbacterium sp.]|nr:tyrosine-protein phosphatase [Microbacterium sp.]
MSTATLTLSAPVNLRDLAGIPVDGGSVRAGFAIRADDLAVVDQQAAEDLVVDGLTAIIDLRSIDEVELTGRGPLGRMPVTYHHVPFMASIGDAGPEAHDQTQFGSMYVRMLENAAPRVVEALAIIAHAPGAVAFHCAAGQDRTGVLAASLLLALGASDDAIVADYVRTGENSSAIMKRLEPTIGRLMSKFGFDLDESVRAAVRKEFSAEPMRILLGSDPLTKLREAGLTDGLVAQLRARATA